MNYILDTHTLIWCLSGDRRVPQSVVDLLNNENNKFFISVVSFWETEIKHIKNPKSMPFRAIDLINIALDNDFYIEQIRDEYLVKLHEIVDQKIHNDPFDHMILSTALDEEMILITHDETLAKYKGVNVLVY